MQAINNNCCRILHKVSFAIFFSAHQKFVSSNLFMIWGCQMATLNHCELEALLNIYETTWHIPQMVCTACWCKFCSHILKVLPSKSISANTSKKLFSHLGQWMNLTAIITRRTAPCVRHWRQHWVNVKHCHSHTGELQTYLSHIWTGVIQGCYSSKTRIAWWRQTSSWNIALRGV